MKTTRLTKKSTGFPVFRFYSDPGHGWLAVKRKLIDELGIADKITCYSYERGQTVYLEEDLDAGTFIKAYKEKFGYSPFIDENSTNKYSPIRSYYPYNPN